MTYEQIVAREQSAGRYHAHPRDEALELACIMVDPRSTPRARLQAADGLLDMPADSVPPDVMAYALEITGEAP